jgi:ATP-binding cassette subfamily B protein
MTRRRAPFAAPPRDFAGCPGGEWRGAAAGTHPGNPQQRFGLQWFWPSIQKYRWVLLEVFVASFFVQLFGLANP